ncbi:MAG: DUF4291 domain-containing protein [Myxococcota bacterium]
MAVKHTELHAEQVRRWPTSGRHILAQFDDDEVIVYQAYRPSIGHYAAKHGHFGGPDFSFSRMSWIKPNFLWMMYRCGWASKPGQEVVLALHLRRAVFDQILAAAVPSTYWPDRFEDEAAWKAAGKSTDVRLQWDPDHDPHGAPQDRRAIQLGLRGATLAGFKGPSLLGVDDVTDFVVEQRTNVGSPSLRTPSEQVYPVANEAVRKALRLD